MPKVSKVEYLVGFGPLVGHTRTLPALKNIGDILHCLENAVSILTGFYLTKNLEIKRTATCNIEKPKTFTFKKL